MRITVYIFRGVYEETMEPNDNLLRSFETACFRPDCMKKQKLRERQPISLPIISYDEQNMCFVEKNVAVVSYIYEQSFLIDDYSIIESDLD